VVMVVGVTLGRAQSVPENDTDHDGLSDAREQALLERFVPQFQVSKADCAVKPALLAEDAVKPTVVDRDGTIYGQVTPRGKMKGVDAAVEVHFYDLWSVDCGRMGHPLDAEHVSVLLRAKTLDSPVAEWRAAYWFAAAHEGTVCDASQVATGKALGAEDKGARVWLSTGKHGAFLSETICTQGCGGDWCIGMVPLKVARVVNIGEPRAAMHGAVWASWPGWPLAGKMQQDFSEEGLARLEKGEGPPIEMNGTHGSVKGTIYVANSVANGLGSSGTNTGAALSTADDKTESALTKSANATGGALKKSTEAVGQFLHLREDKKADKSSPR
jgi:hypothetical protein